MTPGVITCTACGHSAGPGLSFCPACGRPLANRVPVGAATPESGDDPQGRLAYTNSWDSVAPRLQEALYGEFVISRELGRGGMAAVFLAHQLKLNRKVAIKVMAPSLMTGAGLVERFRDEAMTVAQLEHPNIISIFEVGQATGLQYFVMQYVPGRSLERVIRQWGRLPIDVVRGVLFEVGAALAYAHRREVIHRDIKPGNVLLSLDGRVIVGDFGIAKVAQSASRTQTGAVIGTPAYMSPEQCLGRPLTWSADQYSLGVIAYEMLTGVPPFSGTAYAVMRGHIEEPAPDVVSARPDCPAAVAAAVARMMAKRPEDRFASLSEALSALGASRMSMDDAVQEAVGRLAIPLPEEEGVVLVHTPASPAPQQHQVAPPNENASARPGPGAMRIASRKLLAAFAALRHSTMRASTAALAAASSSAEAAVAAVRTAPRRSVVVAGAMVALVVTAVVGGVVLRKGVGSESVGPTALTKADGRGQPPANQVPSTIDSVTALPSDTVTSAGMLDSLEISVDSTEPYRIAIRNVGAGRLTVEDSIDLSAVITDVRGRPIQGLAVRWRSSRRDRATIDSLTGRLVATGSGAVAITATAGDLDTTVTLRILPQPPQRTPVVADHPDADSITVEPRVDIESEKDAVDAARAAFLKAVLEGRDRARIDMLYQGSTADDSIGRALLLETYAERRNLTVKSEQNPPRPVISGDRATSDGRIELEWRRLRQTQKLPLLLHVEFQRVSSGWRPIGFRLRPIR